jgi:hypothetical protein
MTIGLDAARYKASRYHRRDSVPSWKIAHSSNLGTLESIVYVLCCPLQIAAGDDSALHRAHHSRPGRRHVTTRGGPQ